MIDFWRFFCFPMPLFGTGRGRYTYTWGITRSKGAVHDVGAHQPFKYVHSLDSRRLNYFSRYPENYSSAPLHILEYWVCDQSTWVFINLSNWRWYQLYRVSFSLVMISHLVIMLYHSVNPLGIKLWWVLLVMSWIKVLVILLKACRASLEGNKNFGTRLEDILGI